MFRHLGMLMCLLACVVTASAQVVIYSGSVRGKVHGDGGSRAIGYNALLIYDYATLDTTIIVYGRSGGQKFQTAFVMTTDGDDPFYLDYDQASFLELELAGDRWAENWGFLTRNGGASLFTLLQGLQVANVHIGYDGPHYYVAPSLVGNGLLGMGFLYEDGTRDAYGPVSVAFRYNAGLTRTYNNVDGETGGFYPAVVSALQELLYTRYGYPMD